MTTQKNDHSPDELAEVLKNLDHVDWPAVWAGPPSPGQALDDWCTLFGWKPLPGERSLDVRTHTGQRLALYPLSGQIWAPVGVLATTFWNLRADDASENDEVLARVAEVWPTYEAAARSVLGEPTFSGAWDDPAFPEPPHERHWLKPRDLRLKRQSPYRLAVWDAKGPEDRITVLGVDLSVAPTSRTPRGALINLDCYPPEDR
ncbi:hypothetical protein AB0G54_33860 [Streptomyces yokosukanensis]|uniref:hypothetical protein n=1 Tax=Streptomyces yokosukanensis TaxID=67386 RepID=UPI00344970FD